MPSDEELLEQWRRGDSASGNALLSRHFGPIRRFFSSKVAPRDVEDLVQRTFEGCVQKSVSVEMRVGFRSYLFGIARLQLLRYLRSKGQALGRDGTLEQSSIRDLGTSPSSMIAGKQAETLLLTPLQSLPLEQQMLLEMHYWEEMGAAEIAETLSIPSGTVRVRLHRARGRLREALSEQLTDGDLDATARALGRLL